jgi:hypothetical protein
MRGTGMKKIEERIRVFTFSDSDSLFNAFIIAGSVLLISAGGVASAQEHVVTPKMLEPAAIYSPFVDRDYPDQVSLLNIRPR